MERDNNNPRQAAAEAEDRVVYEPEQTRIKPTWLRRTLCRLFGHVDFLPHVRGMLPHCGRCGRRSANAR